MSSDAYKRQAYSEKCFKEFYKDFCPDKMSSIWSHQNLHDQSAGHHKTIKNIGLNAQVTP